MGVWLDMTRKETMVELGTLRRRTRSARTHRVIAWLVIAASALLPTALVAQRAQLERRIVRQTLPNGLEVIVVENHGVPLVTIEANVRNGAFTQGPQFEGLSHLYEHMFFKANEQYPEPDEFISRASELGAVFNATTSEERVNYYLTLPADSAEGGLRFLAAALRAPLFRKDELERERAVVIGEYDRNESNPAYEFTRAMGRALWASAWSRKNPLGERDVILRTTPQQMRAIEQRYYVPNNTALIITGDIAPERAFALARSVLGDWKQGADPFAAEPIPPVPALTANKGIIDEQPIGTVLVMLQWHGPSARGDPAATYAADVFSDVLNQPGSRFQRRLVDSGLFQSLGVNYYTLNQVGPITIQGETTPDKLRMAIAALDEELRHVSDPDYFSTDELEAVKQHRIVDTMKQLERASGFAHQLGFWWAVTGLDYYYGYVDTMAKQTPADLRSYASKYIIGKPRVTGVLLSSDARQALRLTESELAGEKPRP
jgi:zinc protease